MIDTFLLLELTSLGLVSGFLAGLLGVGGGIVMVPALTFILSAHQVAPELSIKMAIASSMATIVFTAIASVRAHQLRGAIRWDVVKHLAPGLMFGSALASAGAFALLRGSYLALFFATFMVLVATQMLLGKQPRATHQLPGRLGMWASGSTIGFVSGLVGIGGGSMSVPFMTWCNVPIHKAIATSAGLGLVIALTNAAGYVMSGQHATGLPPGAYGYIYLPALFVVGAGSVITAPVGAKLSHRLPTEKLKRVFALLLYAVAAYMFFKK